MCWCRSNTARIVFINTRRVFITTCSVFTTILSVCPAQRTALMGQPLEHGVIQRHNAPDVGKQTLVFQQACEGFPQHVKTVPRVAAHSIAQENARTPHALKS
eukprot:CAMPEP_0179450454 /NCGR_PEP_ID=MMETSP0799-20121207/34411_1 /TAXON_ID=46947 /ORGANISM="Geminigera cryophila, Strain CCMP2564" /LENGTH=101 /DNA_ID=CAMNT_0021244535 /DNA_START=1 /DNA_END=306 /DNA_ORIENTATION=+